jgi:hypothetical protein
MIFVSYVVCELHIFSSSLCLSMIGLMNINQGWADLSEYLLAVKNISTFAAPTNVSLTAVTNKWIQTFASLADSVEAGAQDFLDAGDTAGAVSSYYRAYNYLMIAERMMNHTLPSALQTYNASLQFFDMAQKLQEEDASSPDPACTLIAVPYVDTPPATAATPQDAPTHTLRGYFCRASGVGSATPRATVFLQTGYDGTVEMLLTAAGYAAARWGYNVVAFEGPGQGAVSRFGACEREEEKEQEGGVVPCHPPSHPPPHPPPFLAEGLHFRPDWENVVSQVVSFAEAQEGWKVDSNKLVSWGISLGGYLAPRAFSKLPGMAACIADGGMYDFYLMMMCKFPASLQGVFYTDPALFQHYMTVG